MSDVPPILPDIGHRTSDIGRPRTPMLIRPRRNRVSPGVRGLVRETHLAPQHLVLPLFVQEGDGETPIASMPGCARLGIPRLVEVARKGLRLGLTAVALVPGPDQGPQA